MENQNVLTMVGTNGRVDAAALYQIARRLERVGEMVFRALDAVEGLLMDAAPDYSALVANGGHVLDIPDFGAVGDDQIMYQLVAWAETAASDTHTIIDHTEALLMDAAPDYPALVEMFG